MSAATFIAVVVLIIQLIKLALLHVTIILPFLRATSAVPAGTAEARISYGDSVRLSVCHGPVQKQPSEIETPGLHHMIA